MIRKMDMERIIGRVEIVMWENLKMTIDMGMERCIGEMEESIRENG